MGECWGWADIEWSLHDARGPAGGVCRGLWRVVMLRRAAEGLFWAVFEAVWRRSWKMLGLIGRKAKGRMVFCILL